MEDLRNLPVRLTKHTIKRVRERFGLDKNAAHRLAQKICKFGDITYVINGNVKITYCGHSYIFSKTVDLKNDEQVLLMITALNEDKSREWNQYHHGVKRRVSTTKASKIIKNHPVKRSRDVYDDGFDDDEYMCA